ncbi:MAG: ABC transporter ATP-binding protein [Spirochaetia bacterium]
MSRVDLTQVWKIYPRGNVVGVKDLTFTIRDKEFLAILGPSGGGKSSTLRMLAGLEEISRGEISFDGTVVNAMGPAERNIALAFESYALYQRLSVYENIAFPLRARKMPGALIEEKVTTIARLLDLTSLLKKFPPSLAGGQQQRVSLARAFVRQPNLTLLDEPISHMDQRVRAEIRARIRHLHEEMKNTTVYVTHDQAEAVSLCDRMVILHQAQLQQIGTVAEIWNAPANRFVAHFVGEPAMNFIPGRTEGAGSVFIATPQGKRSFAFKGELAAGYEQADVTIGVRPQEIKVAREQRNGCSIPAVVRIAEFQGENTVLTLNLTDAKASELKAVVAATERYAQGESVWLTFAPEILHLFDGEKPILRRSAVRA